MKQIVQTSAEQLAAWRAQVEKELAGAPFEKLVTRTEEGLAIQPLYTETGVDPGLPGAAPFTRGAHAAPSRFQICMKVDPPAHRRPGALAEDLDGGADALWITGHDPEALERASARGLTIVHDAGPDAHDAPDARTADAPRWRSVAPIGDAVRDGGTVDLRALTAIGERAVRVSSVAFHDAGADPADELALMLASAAAYLRALTDGGRPVAAALAALWTRVAVGRDTFGELCKLRALRVCWHKLATAIGAPDAAPPPLHAVCSARTQSQRDPWVNMLRMTTQVFAAALGGADLITPLPFDEALGAASALGRRNARNAALVLREESHLGRVIDPAGGAYYLETRTDQLAREAWRRFTELERDGGIVALIGNGQLHARLEAAWARRAAAIARRKEPVLGVSEFANLDEKLPAPPREAQAHHRDGEAFEALRTRVEAAPKRVALILLGPPSEHRGRLGYAAALFATAGVRAEEVAAPEVGGGGALGALVATLDVACLCGSDERYAAEAVGHARELRAAGARQIVLAGRPGALEADLRAAGVSQFIFVGCDALATLTELLS